MKNKSFIVVIVNNSISELDWIMPVIYSFKKEHHVFLYFKNQNIYKSLKNNKTLFSLTMKMINGYFIEKFSSLFLIKILRKFVNSVNFHFIMNDYFEKKIHSLKRLESIIKEITKIKNVKIDFIFSDYGINSGWVKIITKYNKLRPKIIHYPHSPQSYLLRKKFKPKYKLYGDALLVGRNEDKFFFSNYIDKKKIHSCGIPRYDDWWNKQILKYSSFDFDLKNFKNKNLITFAYVSKFETYEDYSDKLAEQLEDIMQVFSKIENTTIIFKIHPRKNSKKFLSILKNYDKSKWILSKTHLIKLAKVSKAIMCHPNSAAGLDGLSQNIPVVQIWPIKGIESLNDTQKRLGFVKSAKNKKELRNLILLSIKKPKNKIWKDQRKNFSKYFPYQNYYTNISKKIISKV